jgi:hypothetical protein
MLAVFGLSALRIVAPHASIWIPLVVGSAVAMFVLGYLAPFLDPEDEDADDYDAHELPQMLGAGVGATLATTAGRAGPPADDLPDHIAADPRATNKVVIHLEPPTAHRASTR